MSVASHGLGEPTVFLGWIPATAGQRAPTGLRGRAPFTVARHPASG